MRAATRVPWADKLMLRVLIFAEWAPMVEQAVELSQ
jgi:hypothetical protein